MLIPNKYKTLALLIVPVLLAVVGLFFLKVAFPLHSGSPGYDQDPAYAYLFNGLLILEGYPPYHIDHPGTPLQLLFALTIFIRWGLTRVFGEGALNIVDSVINNPEAYLHDMAVLLLVLNLAALVFFGRRIAEATGKIYLGMFCQLSLLSFTVMAPKAAYPAPEALLIFCSLILLSLLAPQIFAPPQGKSGHTTVPNKLFGSIFALGLSVKITFAPMLILFALLPKGHGRRAAIATSLLIFLLLTSPALPNIDRFFLWIGGLISNSGIHGGGTAGFINFNDVPRNLYNLFVWFPLFGISVVLSFIVAAKMALKGDITSVRGPLILLVTAIAQTALVLKHPGAHYMVAVLPISLVLLAWLVTRTEPKNIYIKSAVLLLISTLVIHSVLITLTGINKLAQQRVNMTAALIEINEKMSHYPNALIICSFRCALPQYALTMALIYSPQLISKKIIEKLENFYDYDIFQSTLISIGRAPQSLSVLTSVESSNQPILLITPTVYAGLDTLNLLNLVSQKAQSLYLVIRQNQKRTP